MSPNKALRPRVLGHTISNPCSRPVHAAPLGHTPSKSGLIPAGKRETWPTMLVLDSDPDMLRTLTWFFEQRGFHVAAVANVAEAKDYFHRRPQWTMVIADYHLPDGTGWDFCAWLRERPNAQTIPFLLMSGGLHAATVCPEMDFLAKPFRIEDLESRVRTLLGVKQN
jgi:DNA-binding response OmpR family regulator